MKNLILTARQLLLRRTPIISDIAAVVALRFRSHSFLREMGWFKSYKTGVPIDADGNPVPWFSYASIFFLNGRTQPHWRVFEYGSGGSTMWWAKRVKQVISVEHHEGWYKRVASQMPSNVTLVHRELEEDGAYARESTQHDSTFHVIVVDGRDRVNCAKHALDALSDDGVIVWDNSYRDSYNAGYQMLLDKGFKRLDFRSSVPVGLAKGQTSIFYRDKNCMGL